MKTFYVQAENGELYTGDPMTGDREATPEEIEAWEACPALVQILIDELERKHLMPRVQRDFMLAWMEMKAVQLGAESGLSPEQSVAQLYSKNIGYRKVKELDEQINLLRAKL